MRILYICNEYPPAPHGGIGTYVKFLAEALALKHHVVAIVGFDPTVTHHTVQQCNGVKVYRFPILGKLPIPFSKPIQFFRERWYLSSLVKHVCGDFDPDVVESYDWSGPLLFKPPRGHLVVRMHGAHTVYCNWLGKRASRLFAAMEKRNLVFADSLVAVSKLISDRTIRQFGILKIPRVIYNGVSTECFKLISDIKYDPNKLLFVGRIHHHKGVDLMVKALGIVYKKNPDVYLDAVGPTDSTYAKELIRDIPLEIRSRINFIGRVPNDTLPSVYAGANLCLLPSRVEAFPIVPLESMASGTPVIMSSLVAADEIIEDKQDGYVVDPTNAAAFAACILEALSKRSETSQMRTRCREKILNSFSMDVIVEENEKFYENCLG